ncbi:hypothetical protein AURDEDRAFT_155962 [Auricularia subglabra TFB-10046 SS5]|nr:hypothetical protein AURDEDRAFT_155962 [Auricularia subglabra TFB-10046 SS5]
MEFTLTSNSPSNTQIVGPGITYNVRSSGLTNSHTVISRSDGATVAEIDWRMFSSRVRMGGTETTVNDLLKRTGWQGLHRKFDVGGHSYKWKSYGSLLTLKRDGSAPVAELNRRTFHDSKLHVSADATDILDHIILTMIIVWKIQKRNQAAAASGAVAT